MLSTLQQLLFDLAYTPSLICTVGRSDAIGELMLNNAPQKVEFGDGWAAIECQGWHLHVNLASVVKVRFMEEAGQEGSISPVAVFTDVQRQAVMRFYFPHASHVHRTYTAEELALFGRFKERYQTRLETGA